MSPAQRSRTAALLEAAGQRLEARGAQVQRLNDLIHPEEGLTLLAGLSGGVDLSMWFENGAADGFNVLPPVLPASLNEFVDLVIPELQRRGLFRTEYEGKTLRENLGLTRPQNQHAAHLQESKAA